jgi:hypothetical protein
LLAGWGREASLPDWPSFKAALLKRFDPTQKELFSRLAHCRQERNETVRKYADLYHDLAAQLGVDTQQDPIHMYNFLQGLHVKIHGKVFLMRPRNLEAAGCYTIYVSEGLERQDAPGVPEAFAPQRTRGLDTRGDNPRNSRWDDRRGGMRSPGPESQPPAHARMDGPCPSIGLPRPPETR